MATLREIRRRISGVKSTEKITKAMKMVAAAKLRRAQGALLSARPYSRKLGELMSHLAGGSELDEHPLVIERPVKGVAIIVVAADRGFCGAFNTNIMKATLQHIEKNYSNLNNLGRVTLFAVGKKASDYFSKRNFNVAGNYSGIFHELTFATAKRLVSDVLKGYTDGTYDRVDVVYNEFKSIIQQHLVVDRFLPIPKEALNGDKPKQKRGNYVRHVELQYIYEPGMGLILEKLIPRHLEFQVWRMLLESNAAGEGARMAAMDSASQNASELISSLSLEYNNARQTAITKELLEVVSGAEALNSAR
ncbi:MAG: ATP synthase F1 subunit gamma [Bacteroidetes bacterium]|nr:ATP synthase F1 subunit gamma [Bacteroidota bacterium]